MSVKIIFALLFGLALSQDELTPDNFDNVVDGTKNVFVMFYAPWCGHCKSFKPEYKKVHESFKNEDSVVIASVDADAHKSLGSKFGVQGFPTLKFFSAGSKKPTDFSGDRSASSVINFINSKAGTNAVVIEPPSKVTVLTSSNFDELALGSKNALVEFYAPWCGHCKKLIPIYEQLAEVFEQDEDVVIAKVDATVESELAQNYDVSGYPTLKFFPAGSSTAQDYNKGRALPDFVTFMNENAGTRRNPDGSLAKAAGRIEELDEIAHGIYGGNKKLSDLENKCGDYEGDECKYYVKFAKKIGDKGKNFVGKEKNRLLGMVKSTSVKKSVRDRMRIRINVLNGFLEGPETFEPKKEL